MVVDLKIINLSFAGNEFEEKKTSFLNLFKRIWRIITIDKFWKVISELKKKKEVIGISGDNLQ